MHATKQDLKELSDGIAHAIFTTSMGNLPVSRIAFMILDSSLGCEREAGGLCLEALSQTIFHYLSQEYSNLPEDDDVKA